MGCYTSRSRTATSLAVTDANGDGIGDAPVIFASGFVLSLGLTLVDGDLYVSDAAAFCASWIATGTASASASEPVVTGLPVGGVLHANHPNNGIVLGPDGYLCVGVGIDPESPGPTSRLKSASPTWASVSTATAILAAASVMPLDSLSTAGTVDERAGTIVSFSPDGSDMPGWSQAKYLAREERIRRARRRLLRPGAHRRREVRRQRREGRAGPVPGGAVWGWFITGLRRSRVQGRGGGWEAGPRMPHRFTAGATARSDSCGRTVAACFPWRASVWRVCARRNS